jgi:hypothetical protein
LRRRPECGNLAALTGPQPMLRGLLLHEPTTQGKEAHHRP